MDLDGTLRRLRLTEFNNQGDIVSMMQAERATIHQGRWSLKQVQRQEFDPPGYQATQLVHSQFEHFDWACSLTLNMISVALLAPERMSTTELYRYINHLQRNEQASQRHEIEFWRKIFYPLSCLVMTVLALPFAYLRSRSSNVAGWVFLGVLVGISFFLLNNVFGYLGNLNQWEPWFAAAIPGLLYSVASLGAFGWLVWRR